MGSEFREGNPIQIGIKYLVQKTVMGVDTHARVKSVVRAKFNPNISSDDEKTYSTMSSGSNDSKYYIIMLSNNIGKFNLRS